MKISEAMAIGSTFITPLAGIYLNRSKTGGCAWGMVDRAAPTEVERMIERARDTRIVALPCGCKPDEAVLGPCLYPMPAACFCNLADVIVHLFNDHVMTRKDWTLNQLIDWVRTAEPRDPKEQVTEHDTKETLVHA